MPKENKANRAEVARRLSVVQQLIIKGFTTREIEAYAKDKWDINRVQVSSYIRKATAGFADLITGEVKAELDTALERRLSLFRKMEKSADNPKCADVALKILQDISRLKGQYVEQSVHKHELTGKDGQPLNDPLSPISLQVNVISSNADIQPAAMESTAEQEAGNP